MISLFENNRECDNIHVYLLGDSISEENRHTLSDIASKYQRAFTLINVPDLNIPEKLSSARWPKSAFTRMFAGELMPKAIDKVIYLDCDTIISASIKDLSLYPTDNYTICGVKDCVSRPYKDKIGIVKNGSYINAGVLLMNLNKLRQFDIRTMIADFVDKYESAISYADQDILNGIFKGIFGVLPHPDNYYTEDEIEYSKKYPRIIHYTTCMLNIRPWCVDSKHTFAWMFDKYQSMSPWANKEKTKANFSAKEYKIIRRILTLPPAIAYRVLGLIHAYLRPYYIIGTSKLGLR